MTKFVFLYLESICLPLAKHTICRAPGLQLTPMT